MSVKSILMHLVQRLIATWMLLQLLFMISVAQLMVATMPFRFYARWLQRNGDGPVAPPPLVHSLRRKIDIAAKILPWRPQCFPQALAGRYFLRRRGYRSSFSLGVSDPSDMRRAHAWLTSGDLFVSGREQRDNYREVARFEG
jgi:Transglutaminase-like superfamily